MTEHGQDERCSEEKRLESLFDAYIKDPEATEEEFFTILSKWLNGPVSRKFFGNLPHDIKEEGVQEVLLTLFQIAKSRGLKHIANLRKYVYVMFMNKGRRGLQRLNAANRDKKWTDAVICLESARRERMTHDPLKIASRNEECALVLAKIRKYARSEERENTLILALWGMSSFEISERTGVRQGTVEQRLWRFRKILRKNSKQ